MGQHQVDGLQGQSSSEIHQSVIDILHVGICRDGERFLEDDAARIDILVEEEGRHARLGLAIDDGPVDGSRTTILGQEGRMDIERAEARHIPDDLGQKAEGHDHLEVGLIGPERLHKLGVLHLHGLEDGDVVLLGIDLDGRRLEAVLMATHGFVGLRDHGHDQIAILYQSTKGSHGKLGRSHEYDL